MSGLNWQEILSAFVVLFAVIDMAGLTPVIIDQRNQGVEIPPGRTALYSLAVFLIFFFWAISSCGSSGSMFPLLPWRVLW
jgi:hypothetical protein